MDLIERQAAIDAIVGLTNCCESLRELYEYVVEHDLNDRWIGGLVDAADAVIGLPSVDVQPERHGRWIEEPNCMYRCSSCGSHYPSIRGYMDYCYCPSCGALMDERSE